MSTESTLTKREAVVLFGLEDPRIARARRISPQQAEAAKAAARVAREQCLRVGMIARFEGENFIVIAAFLTRLGLHHMVDMSKYRNPPLVYWDSDQACYQPTVAMVYLPRSGYNHIQSFRFDHHHVTSRCNNMLRQVIESRLTPEEWYENEYGRFWLQSAVSRIVSELKAAAAAAQAAEAEPEQPPEPIETFCAKCGHAFIDDDPFRRSKRCPACRVGDANMGNDPRYCIGCGKRFVPYQNGAKRWKCGDCTALV